MEQSVVFSDLLRVSFHEGIKQLADVGHPFSKMNPKGEMWYDLRESKDRFLLQILLDSEAVHLNGVVYSVISKEYSVDGNAVMLNVVPKE